MYTPWIHFCVSRCVTSILCSVTSKALYCITEEGWYGIQTKYTVKPLPSELSVKVEQELTHMKHVRNEAGQKYQKRMYILREHREENSQVTVSFKWKHLGNELCSVQIVKVGVRHRFLDRRKEGAPGTCYSLFIQVIAIVIKITMAYNQYFLPGGLGQMSREERKPWILTQVVWDTYSDVGTFAIIPGNFDVSQPLAGYPKLFGNHLGI